MARRRWSRLGRPVVASSFGGWHKGSWRTEGQKRIVHNYNRFSWNRAGQQLTRRRVVQVERTNNETEEGASNCWRCSCGLAKQKSCEANCIPVNIVPQRRRRMDWALKQSERGSECRMMHCTITYVGGGRNFMQQYWLQEEEGDEKEEQ